jgi:predicted nucleic acid-binding protein
VTRLVVDSSVVIKWSVPEVHSAGALHYLDPDLERDAPELLLAEVSNILWKKVGRGELTRDEAERIAADLGQADITIHPMGPLFGPALRIALETGRSAYDCIYLALAETLTTRVVTADRRLYNALQGGPYAGLILWVEDGP